MSRGNDHQPTRSVSQASDLFVELGARLLCASLGVYAALVYWPLTALLGIGVSWWFLLRLHLKHWGTPTAAVMMRATLTYVLTLLGSWLLANSPLRGLAAPIIIWGSVLYAAVVLFLDATGDSRNQARPARRGERNSLKDYLK